MKTFRISYGISTEYDYVCGDYIQIIDGIICVCKDGYVGTNLIVAAFRNVSAVKIIEN